MLAGDATRLEVGDAFVFEELEVWPAVPDHLLELFGGVGTQEKHVALPDGEVLPGIGFAGVWIL